jgi:DDB1- and CUL4-associated factor 7
LCKKLEVRSCLRPRFGLAAIAGVLFCLRRQLEFTQKFIVQPQVPDPKGSATVAQPKTQESEMPFHLHSSSSSSQNNAQQMPHGAASGILQAAQNLGSFGAPTGNLNNAISGQTTTSGTDRLYSSSGTTPGSNSGEAQAAPPSARAPQQSLSTGAAMNQQQQFETPRRPRQEDIHQASMAANMASQRIPISPREYAPTGPRINLEQATPESSQYHAPSQLPPSLQPGRPAVMSVNTAPAIPTVPQSNAQDQYTTPSRSSAISLAHTYTRSSPATALEAGQVYSPFSTTTPNTDQGYFAPPTNPKYTPAQRTISNTPLGLADIRPRADSGLSDGLAGANPYSYDGANATPTNSNYLAPWAIYAFDWCKWPAHNHDGGKLAVGSYLEDGHNFVSLVFEPLICKVRTLIIIILSDPNTRLADYAYPS